MTTWLWQKIQTDAGSHAIRTEQLNHRGGLCFQNQTRDSQMKTKYVKTIRSFWLWLFVHFHGDFKWDWFIEPECHFCTDSLLLHQPALLGNLGTWLRYVCPATPNGVTIPTKFAGISLVAVTTLTHQHLWHVHFSCVDLTLRAQAATPPLWPAALEYVFWSSGLSITQTSYVTENRAAPASEDSQYRAIRECVTSLFGFRLVSISVLRFRVYCRYF